MSVELREAAPKARPALAGSDGDLFQFTALTNSIIIIINIRASKPKRARLDPSAQLPSIDGAGAALVLALYVHFNLRHLGVNLPGDTPSLPVQVSESQE